MPDLAPNIARHARRSTLAGLARLTAAAAVAAVLSGGAVASRSAGAAGAAGAAEIAVHPQDGAHADVRIRLEDGRLRWRIGMNLAFMDEVASVGREREDALDPIEEPRQREAVLRLLLEENQVIVDGVEIEADVETFVFHRPDATMLPLFPRTGMRGLIRAQIVLDYPLAAPPEEIRMTWARYPLDLLSAELEGGDPAPMVLESQFQAEGVVDLIRFSEGSPEIVWHATGMTIDDRLAPVPDLLGPAFVATDEAAERTTEPRPAAVTAPPRTGSTGPEPTGPRADEPVTVRSVAPLLGGPAGERLPSGSIPVLSAACVIAAGLLGLGAAAPWRARRPRIAGAAFGFVLLVAAIVALPHARTDRSGVIAIRRASDAAPTVLVATAAPEASPEGTVADPVPSPGPGPDRPAPAVADGSVPAAAPAPTTGTAPEAALAVFRPLLANVYTAFDYSEESDVYDALAHSVDGPLLDALYRRIHRGLVMDDHDRAVARVTDVALLDAVPDGAETAPRTGRFSVLARWRVDGTVVHWGHSHTRRNEYAARYQLARTDRGWRIVEQEILEQRRIPTRSDPLDQGVAAGIPADLEF